MTCEARRAGGAAVRHVLLGGLENGECPPTPCGTSLPCRSSVPCTLSDLLIVNRTKVDFSHELCPKCENLIKNVSCGPTPVPDQARRNPNGTLGRFSILLLDYQFRASIMNGSNVLHSVKSRRKRTLLGRRRGLLFRGRQEQCC